jgi:hypothetical protein
MMTVKKCKTICISKLNEFGQVTYEDIINAGMKRRKEGEKGEGGGEELTINIDVVIVALELVKPQSIDWKKKYLLVHLIVFFCSYFHPFSFHCFSFFYLYFD